MVNCFTLRVRAAGIGLGAWVDALSVAALFACLAVDIADTFNSATFNLRIALKSLRARAQGVVITNTAFSSRRAIGLFAGISTFASNAGLCVHAIGVCRATRSTGTETADMSLRAGDGAGALQAASAGHTLFAARTLRSAGTGFNAYIALAAFGSGRTTARFGA